MRIPEGKVFPGYRDLHHCERRRRAPVRVFVDNGSEFSRRMKDLLGDSMARERIASSIPQEIAKPFPIVAQSHVALDGNIIGDGAIFCGFSHVAVVR
jgi:hypothetical protein